MIYPRVITAILVLVLAGAAPDYSNYQERWLTPPRTPNPRLAHKSYHSAAMNVEVGYSIYLPAGYDAVENRQRRYPVIYWLHGLNQSESTDQFPTALLDRAIKAGQIPPVMVVYATGGGRAFYTDSPDGKILGESTIIKELIPHIDVRWRTIATRAGRAIQGMSMGGYGALKLAIKHPEMFSSVAAFAPSLRTPENIAATYPDIINRMFGGEAKNFAAEHPINLFREQAETLREQLPVAIFVGGDDHLLAGSRQLHEVLQDLRYPHTYVEFAGIAHNLPKLTNAVQMQSLEFAARFFCVEK